MTKDSSDKTPAFVVLIILALFCSLFLCYKWGQDVGTKSLDTEKQKQEQTFEQLQKMRDTPVLVQCFNGQTEPYYSSTHPMRDLVFNKGYIVVRETENIGAYLYGRCSARIVF